MSTSATPTGACSSSSHTSAEVCYRAVLGLAAYLALKFFLVGILALHLFSSYVYLGELPLWSFVNTTAHGLLRPLQWLPLRAGRMDFAPVLAMVLLLLTAPFSQRGLTQIFQRLI